MKWEDFVDEYVPVKNKVAGAAIDGFMFETFGDEIKDLKTQAQLMCKSKDDNYSYYVWTVVDGEGSHLFLINGWHFVNRLGYILTEKAWKEGEDIEVKI